VIRPGSSTTSDAVTFRCCRVYDIVDDRPVSLTEMIVALAERAGDPRPIVVPAWLPRLMMPYLAPIRAMRLPLSNAKARSELGWRPAHPTYRQGLEEVARRAARGHDEPRRIRESPPAAVPGR
jgi:nucleoside-diphosphate-sugar epimerase